MANCNECKQLRAKESDKPLTISIFEHENAMTRLERCNRRLWIALLVALSTICVLCAVTFSPQEVNNHDIEKQVQK